MRWLWSLVTKAQPLGLTKFSQGALTSRGRPLLTTHVRRCSQVTQSSKYSTSAAVKRTEKDGLSINIHGEWRYLNYVWLRDHCRCSECYNFDTFQKIILPPYIDPDIQPAQVNADDENLTVMWPNGHESKYDLEWLKKNSNPGSEESKVSKLLWDNQIISKTPPEAVEYETFMSDDAGVKDLLYSLLRYGFGVVKGAPVSIKGTQEVSERVSHIQGTLFSQAMWSFTSDHARSDTAYTAISLGAHSDTTYFSIPCGIQVFHKLFHDGEGGETLLVDGFYAVENLRREKLESFNILCEHRVEHQYKEQKNQSHDVISLAPILQVHPVTEDLEWIRYNHYDRAPIRTVPTNQLSAYYEALRDLSKLIEDPASQFWLPLAPGSVLFVDNWRVLHGRASFTGNRKVCGCYLPRDDWISRARTLGLLC